jgi:cardiolipin synthase
VDGQLDEDAGWATWPNLVTLIRLLLLPLYAYLVLETSQWVAAGLLLGTLGATDWVDGFLARRLHQVSKVGKIIDPVADRLLVVTALLTIAYVGAVPWWFAGATLVREVVISSVVIALAIAGAARIDVLWWGKVSTFALMTAYPFFLFTCNPDGSALSSLQHALRIANWVVAAFGLIVAWYVLFAYIPPAMRALRAGRQGRDDG